MKDTMSLKVGDFVWAKMKGYKAWPAKIVKPVKDVKQPAAKKPMQYVYFFGTENHAWIPEESIFPYKENEEKFVKDKDKEAKRRSSFWLAVEAIEEEIDPSKNQSKSKAEEDAETNGVVSKNKPEETNHSVQEKKKSPKPKKSNEHQSTEKLTPKKFAVKRRRSDSESEKPKKKFKKTETNASSSSSSLLSMNSHYSLPPLQSYVPHLSPSRQSILNRPYVEPAELPALDVGKVSKFLKEKGVTACKLKFGFLGIGIMGRGIVKNLLNSGHHITVWNRTPEKCQDFIKAGAFKGQTPADVVAASDITFCCVSDSSVVKELVFGNCGVLQEMTSRKGYVEVTSIDPDTSHDVSEAVISRGGRYLEAPVIGCKEISLDGQLIVVAAGDRSLFTDCSSCFQAMGKHAFYLGSEVGCATRMNAVFHTIMGVVVASLAETFSLSKVIGIRQEDLLEIINIGPLKSVLTDEKGHEIIKGKFEPSMPLIHMQKDMQILMSIANKHDHPMYVSAAANESYKQAKRKGYGDLDVSAIYLKSAGIM